MTIDGAAAPANWAVALIRRGRQRRTKQQTLVRATVLESWIADAPAS